MATKDPEENYARVKAWRARPENKAKRAAEARRWRERHPELAKEIRERHRANNIERIREAAAKAARAKRRNDPEGQRKRMQAFKARLRAEQEEIAGRPAPDHCELCGEAGRTVFDHCHTHGKFRGWLCDRCNRVLGSVNDDAALLRRLADYIEEHGSGPIDRQTTKVAPKERLRSTKQTSLPLE